ncbi:MAG: hypothetical protein R3B81_17145 [bacterium]
MDGRLPGCPETKLAGVAFIPRTGWNQLSWNLWSPETPFLLTFTFGSNENIPALVGIGTDHPAAGPSGPTSCGNCFPSNRSTHSFMYGSEADPICPGEPFDDGVCVAELMFVLHREFFDYVEPSSWGRVKHLYR